MPWTLAAKEQPLAPTPSGIKAEWCCIALGIPPQGLHEPSMGPPCCAASRTLPVVQRRRRLGREPGVKIFAQRLGRWGRGLSLAQDRSATLVADRGARREAAFCCSGTQ